MTFSILRSRWSFGTSISKSTITASLRASFPHFSIHNTPVSSIIQESGAFE